MKSQSTKSSGRKPRRRSERRPRGEPLRAQLVTPLREQIRGALLESIQGAVESMARELVEAEVVELVGAPWSRKAAANPLRRGGRTRSRIQLGGEPLLIERTRVRDAVAGREHPLETLLALASRDALDEDVKALLVRGVSTRDYDGALCQVADGLGLQKSAVSEAFQRASKKDLDALTGRPLGDLKMAAIFIDGVHFVDVMTVVALGVDTEGRKHVLGLAEGATENSQVVKDLLVNLDERGLVVPRRCLFVLDGAKALSKAVADTFGKRALVQRCQLHKLRNVLGYLPPSRHAEASRRLRAAWNLNAYDEAKAELARVHRWLKGISEAAANSLAEGLEETLTVHRLGIHGALRSTLKSTNPIDSAFDVVRANSRRVKRWRGSAMVMRWTATGLVRAERSFRRVKGHKQVADLVRALENDHLHAANVAA